MAVLRGAPSWPNIASSDGGGIRYGMWAFVAAMNVSDPVARSSAAQALAQFETYRAINPFGGEEPNDYPTEEEILTHQGPSFNALYTLWDRQDREAFISEVLAGFDTVSTQDDTSAGSPFWKGEQSDDGSVE